MAINGSGIRDTARVLGINKNTIIRTLKKAETLTSVNPIIHRLSTNEEGLSIELQRFSDVEVDEQWSLMWVTSLSSAGYSMRLATQRKLILLVFLADVRMMCLCN